MLKSLPQIGAWRSLVARLLWEQEVGGSNPLAPTNDIKHLGITPGCFSFVFRALYSLDSPHAWFGKFRDHDCYALMHFPVSDRISGTCLEIAIVYGLHGRDMA